MTRTFDPVLSAALRTELEALAGGAEASVPTPRPHVRPQVWITVATAIVLVLATVGVLRLTGGGGEPPAGGGDDPLGGFQVPDGVTDPLAEILDERDDAYIRATPQVLLRGAGTSGGTTRFSFDVPAGVPTVRPYLNCAPESSYSLSIDGAAVTSGTCDPTYGGSFMELPVEPGQHIVAVRVRGVEDAAATGGFALLLIATPEYTPSAPRAAEAPLPYPTDLAEDEVLARTRGDSRIATGRIPGSMRGVSISITCEGDGTITVATPFGTLGDPADRATCGSTAKQTGSGMSGQTLESDPEFTITPYGDVRWTVTFMTMSD